MHYAGPTSPVLSVVIHAPNLPVLNLLVDEATAIIQISLSFHHNFVTSLFNPSLCSSRSHCREKVYNLFVFNEDQIVLIDNKVPQSSAFNPFPSSLRVVFVAKVVLQPDFLTVFPFCDRDARCSHFLTCLSFVLETVALDQFLFLTSFSALCEISVDGSVIWVGVLHLLVGIT